MYFVEEVGLVDDVCVLAWVREFGLVNWLFLLVMLLEIPYGQ